MSFDQSFRVECSFRSPSFLFPSFPSLLSESRDRPFSRFPSRFQPPSSSFNKRHDFLPPTFRRSSHSSFSRATLVSPFLPPILALPPPPAPIHAAPNLNPIFHITSRKSYSAGARRGRKQRATHGSRTKERRNIFIFSLLPSFLFLVFLLSLLSPRAVRSKTISEHIARVRLRSLPSNPGAFPAPSRRARPAPAAMSSRLFDPRGRRNNACTVARSHSFPLFSSFAVLTLSLLAFRHARNFLGEKSPSNSSSWPLQ